MDRIKIDNLQIRDLRSVFSERYHFKVVGKPLNPITEKKISPRRWLQKHLADFVYDEDEKDSLLIIYYAGHGNPGPDGELMLTGYVPQNIIINEL
jgi:hypothetical protein